MNMCRDALKGKREVSQRYVDTDVIRMANLLSFCILRAGGNGMPYQFLREKKWRCLDSNLCVRYRMASPKSSPQLLGMSKRSSSHFFKPSSIQSIVERIEGSQISTYREILECELLMNFEMLSLREKNNKQ